MSSIFPKTIRAFGRKLGHLIQLSWFLLRLPLKFLQMAFLVISSLLDNFASSKFLKKRKSKPLFHIIYLSLRISRSVFPMAENSIGRFCSCLDKSPNGRRYLAFSLVLLLCLMYYNPFCFIFRRWGCAEKGIASYYSSEFYFRRTASGEIFVPFFYTAAHNSLPMGTYVLVKNMDNGRKIVVKINDRGPFKKGRIIDLSPLAAHKLGIIRHGLAPVEIHIEK